MAWLEHQVGEPGFGYLVRTQLEGGGAICDFEVYKQHGAGDDGVYYEREGSTGPLDNPTLKPDEAVMVCNGGIKWDGCSNVHWQPNDPVMMHLCGPEAWEAFAEMTLELPKLALKTMKRESFG